jgi:hypothetical protein
MPDIVNFARRDNSVATFVDHPFQKNDARNVAKIILPNFVNDHALLLIFEKPISSLAISTS